MAEEATKEVEVKAADMQAANDNIVLLTKRLEAAEVKLARPAIGKAANDNEPSAELKAFRDYLRYADRASDLKTLTVAVDPQGGYLAPPEISTEMIRNLVQFSPVRGLASVRTTMSPSVLYPARTGVTNATWASEIADPGESEPAFGQREIVINEVKTYVDISNQLLADSAGVAEAEVRLALAEDFGAKEGLAFISGNGVGRPTGVMTDTGVAYTASGAATAIVADAFLDMFYALTPAYRNAGTWLMNGTTLAAVRKLKDGEGRYLWQPSLIVGQPETILGRPVVEAVDMDNIGANTYPVVFGDFGTGYRIVDRVTLSMLVNPYSLATTGITRIHATRRVGGGVIQSAAFRKLKIAVS